MSTAIGRRGSRVKASADRKAPMPSENQLDDLLAGQFVSIELQQPVQRSPLGLLTDRAHLVAQLGVEHGVAWRLKARCPSAAPD